MALKFSGMSLCRSFARSNMPNAAYNLRGLQNLGFTWSMLPGLRDLYPKQADFVAACRRYAIFHNCHPFWGPYLTGAFLHTERSIAAGKIDPSRFGPIKEAMLNSLSAIGDSFFSGSLDTLFFMLLLVLTGLGCAGAACLFFLFWLLTALAMKIFTFYLGLSRGFQAMALLRRFDLINWGDRLKRVSAFVLLAFLTFSLRPWGRPGFSELARLAELAHAWFLPLSMLLLFGYLAARLHYSRSLLLCLLLLLLAL
ncbi:MAG: PTS system mannose/fructose/sorbose family transporter subunit IID [Deltaproteobacteria bacterium]|jgi:PTS system mannose-specific IID component|nr:PTS system mannose/fructose/sorbose family transporter subunit IID [Deltaproteobacteria bacterium]